MATKDEATQFLNKELDRIAKKLKTKKVKHQETFDSVKANKLSVIKKTK